MALDKSKLDELIRQIEEQQQSEKSEDKLRVRTNLRAGKPIIFWIREPGP